MRGDLAGRLSELRDLTGRSVRDLARATGTSSSSLSRYFTGQAVAPWPTVVALCKVANRDPRPLRAVWEQAKQSATPPEPARQVRNDLPQDLTAFTGRQLELAMLLDAAQTTRVVAIDGMGGVGKSALAVHAAHLLTVGFVDGQLYLDLHGFTPGRERVEPGEALRILLSALGLPAARIPDGTAERAAVWRSELATRRTLVVLDNAANADQVRDLLPGAGESFVVITSRRRMVELDALPISLDVLPAHDAAELFARSVGGVRAGDVDEVLRRCGNLPLAIRVAAARLRHRPAWTLDTLVERMSDGDMAVSDVFAMSLQQLDPAQRRMFRLLGQVPGEDIDAHAAAALADVPLGNARSLLEDLVDAHLLQEPTPGRYRMHDLLRQTARTDNTGHVEDVAPAIRRLAAYYLAGLQAVKHQIRILFPLPIAVPLPDPPALPDHDAAVRWLDAEWDNQAATLVLAVQFGLDDVAVGLAQIATIAHGQRGGSAELYRGLELTLPMAEQFGSRVLASHRYLLGVLRLRTGKLPEATQHLEAAQQLMDGDLIGEAMTLFQLGELREEAGDGAGAVAYLRQASDLLPSDATAVRARIRSTLGQALVRTGDYEAAEAVATEVLEAADPQTTRMALDVLGQAALARGDAAAALDYAEQAVAVSRTTQHALFEALSLADAGVALIHLDRPAEAAAQHAEAVRILERAGEPHQVARIQARYHQALH